MHLSVEHGDRVQKDDTFELTESEAAKIIKKGGIIIYPTEGIYGLGCDPLNKSSVENIFKIKGRSKEKSLLYSLQILNI